VSLTATAIDVIAQSGSTKGLALGIGAGLGTIGPGIGVGYIFGKVIESVQWLGFALTEAIVFYAFIFGLIAFFLG
jgi:F-type H+-transporting ATPase subunit c